MVLHFERRINTMFYENFYITNLLVLQSQFVDAMYYKLKDIHKKTITFNSI